MNQLKFNSNNGSPCALNGAALSWFTHRPLSLCLAVFMIGVWKDIEGYEGFYQVSNMVKVRSLDRVVNNNGGKWLVKGRILKPNLNSHGYLQVILCKNGIHRAKTVHRLIAEAFIKNPNNYPQINHKNGIKTDNRVDNLEWCDQSHNMRHAYKNGLSSKIGEKNSRAKLTKKQVIEIKARLLVGFKCVGLAKEYDVNPATISDIKTEKSWSHV